MTPKTKTVQQLMNDGLRLIGIDRRGNVARIACPTTKQSEIELTFQPDWNAWSIRLAKGPHQQLCAFEPSQEEADIAQDYADCVGGYNGNLAVPS